MAQLNFGGTTETVVIRDEFPLEKAREVLKNETIAVIGYGVQGPGQALNLRDNGFNVIVGQREGKTYDKAVADGWVPGETLFGIKEAAKKAIDDNFSRYSPVPGYPALRNAIVEKLKKENGLEYTDRKSVV